MQTISPVLRWTYTILLVIVLSWPGMNAPMVKADSQVFNPAVLVKDINTATLSSNPSNLSVLGNTLLFGATADSISSQLWAVNSNATNIFQVKAVEAVTPVVVSHGVGYFAGRDADHGSELWRTDGTAAGTQLFADLLPGPADSSPQELIDINGVLFFVALVADPAGNVRYEVWKSDGTAAGTLPITNRPSDKAFPPRDLTKVNDKLFFVTVELEKETSLWVSNGTTAGTRLLKSFAEPTIQASTITDTTGEPRPGGPFLTPKNYYYLTAIGNTLFFRANDTVHGMELWRSDGTVAGTTLVTDLKPGTEGSQLYSLVNFQGTLFFATVDGLWKSDGTAAGTLLVKTMAEIGPLFPVGNVLYLTALDTTFGLELWRSDGTATGTFLIKDINPGRADANIDKLTAVQNKIFFVADDGVHGWELWQSDGTAAGTTLVKDIATGPSYSAPNFLTALGNRLFFQADDNQHGFELWSSDGTAAGTTLIADLNRQPRGSRPSALTAVGTNVFFTAEVNSSGIRQLWRSDGTTAGTQPIEQIKQDIYENSDLIMPTSNNDLYVTTAHRRTLWHIDNVTGTASLLKTFQKDYINNLVTINNRLLFSLSSDLWQSDGTAAGTQQIIALQVGTEMIVINNTLYFWGYTTELGAELWKSDGTAAGTTLLKDINPGAGDARPMMFTNVNGTLFFRADDGSHGGELWKSDGTTAGTVLVKDTLPGPDGSFFGWPTAVNNRLFFVSSDRLSVNYEVWVSDGTEAGTFMLKDIHPDEHIPTLQPAWLTAVGNNLLFVANDDTTNGGELWISDGTTEGTTLLKDINQGVDNLTNVNGAVFFAATDGSGQRTLWRSDGTAAGTQQLQKIAPQARLYNLQQPAFVAAGNHIFFSADNGATGQELWQIPLNTNAPTLNTLPLIGTPAGGIGRIHLDYGNQSSVPQQGVTLTADLAAGLTYLDSSSPVTPTVTGNTLVWQLPDLGVLAGGEIDLRVQTPAAPLGTRYPVTLTLTMVTGTDAPSQATTMTVDVMVADLYYLPFVQK